MRTRLHRHGFEHELFFLQVSDAPDTQIIMSYPDHTSGFPSLTRLTDHRNAAGASNVSVIPYTPGAANAMPLLWTVTAGKNRGRHMRELDERSVKGTVRMGYGLITLTSRFVELGASLSSLEK